MSGLQQDNAIASLVRVMREAYAEERKTLFVVGSYHIGKERAFLGAAKALDFKIWCHQAKKKVQAVTTVYALVYHPVHAPGFLLYFTGLMLACQASTVGLLHVLLQTFVGAAGD